MFSYLDAFDTDHTEVAQLKEQYQKGGLGDMVVKKRLMETLEAFLRPIQEKRKELEQNKSYINDILKKGTQEAQTVAASTLYEVKRVMYLDYF